MTKGKGASKKVVGKYDKESARIGFHEWKLSMEGKVADVLNAMLQEGMEIATEEYECSAWFPLEWSEEGDDGPDDPTTICVELPLGPTDDEGPRWTFALTDLVDRFIDLNEQADGMFDDATKPHAIRLRDALRELADKIDERMPADKGGSRND